MAIELRYYQEDAVNSVFSYFVAKSGNPIIAMPTGTGKSIVIAELVRRILEFYPGQRVQMVTHVKTLIQQNHKKLLEQWSTAPAGIHSQGLKRRDHDHPIIFGGIQSMYKRAKQFGHIDLLIVDECHLVPPSGETMYGKYITDLLEINPKLKVIGLSATPYRLKGGHLVDGGMFSDVCYDNTQLAKFNRLITEGYLAPVIPKQTHTTIDATGLHLKGGEFITSEVEERVHGDVTYQALRETIREGHDRQHWLVFAVSIAHANDIVDTLNNLGIDAVAYHSEMPAEEADQNLRDFATGKCRAIVSRDRLTTGVDLPEVDLICMLRLTRSPGLWVQMLGRGTRPFPGKKDCLVLDFAGNTRRLGPINDPLIPSTGARGNGGGGGEAPVKACPQCLVFQPAGARVCDYCGYEFPRVVEITPTASTQELIRQDRLPPQQLPVSHVVYHRHKKAGRPDSLCVTYYAGLLQIREYVCPDHNGYAARRAQHWLATRLTKAPEEGLPVCQTHLDMYLALLGKLRVPSTVTVDTNGKFPELLNVTF